MHTFFESNQRDLIDELKSFGLNPKDWEARDSRGPDEHLILAHREDDDVRIAVKLHSDGNESSIQGIREVEWLVTGA